MDEIAEIQLFLLKNDDQNNELYCLVLAIVIKSLYWHEMKYQYCKDTIFTEMTFFNNSVSLFTPINRVLSCDLLRRICCIAHMPSASPIKMKK